MKDWSISLQNPWQPSISSIVHITSYPSTRPALGLIKVHQQTETQSSSGFGKQLFVYLCHSWNKSRMSGPSPDMSLLLLYHGEHSLPMLCDKSLVVPKAQPSPFSIKIELLISRYQKIQHNPKENKEWANLGQAHILHPFGFSPEKSWATWLESLCFPSYSTHWQQKKEVKTGKGGIPQHWPDRMGQIAS